MPHETLGSIFWPSGINSLIASSIDANACVAPAMLRAVSDESFCGPPVIAPPAVAGAPVAGAPGAAGAPACGTAPGAPFGAMVAPACGTTPLPAYGSLKPGNIGTGGTVGM